ncbi:hypothetical protein [Telmatospirillum sp.]|uniref:hypothetical protein n=1 Tax=Telmatospirillum sp. TaxID=2079197 RepID=UPI0028458324|nr:hypothetical protein [Telmatospirillum sp.]MDR3438567.1 hypothetical protein [Telmatospirillum sp.]
MDDTAYVQAFDLMWELFSEPTLLVRNDHTIVAANAAARRMGRTEGEKCFETLGGNGAQCLTCKADQALRERVAISDVNIDLGVPITTYWLPLPDSPDLYVHFGIGLAQFREGLADRASSQDQE